MSSLSRRTRVRPQTTAAVAETETAAPEAQPSNTMLSGVMSSRRTRQKMGGSRTSAAGVMGSVRRSSLKRGTAAQSSTAQGQPMTAQAATGQAAQSVAASYAQNQQQQEELAALEAESAETQAELDALRDEIAGKMDELRRLQEEEDFMRSVEEQAARSGKAKVTPQSIAMDAGRTYIPSAIIRSWISNLQAEISALELELVGLTGQQEDEEAQMRLLMILIGADPDES